MNLAGQLFESKETLDKFRPKTRALLSGADTRGRQESNSKCQETSTTLNSVSCYAVAHTSNSSQFLILCNYCQWTS